VLRSSPETKPIRERSWRVVTAFVHALVAARERRSEDAEGGIISVLPAMAIPTLVR
jgi:hypothetical protein